MTEGGKLLIFPGNMVSSVRSYIHENNMSVELLPFIDLRPDYVHSFLYVLFLLLLIITVVLSVLTMIRKLWFYIKREVFIIRLKREIKQKGRAASLRCLAICLFHITARNISDTPFAYPSAEWLEAVTCNLKERQSDKMKQILLEVIFKPLSAWGVTDDKELAEAELLVIKLIRNWYV